MNFLAPEVLIGALTALIPLILHLLFRKKPKVVTLPTLRFVLMSNRKTLKRHRLRRRLLLLIRMLLLGLAAFSMARPLLNQSIEGVGGASYEDLVLVLDNSYFSDAKFEGEVLLDHMRRDAAQFISASTKGTAVVLTCQLSNSKGVTLSVDKAAARAVLSNAEAQQQLGDLQAAVSKAQQLLMDPALSRKSGTIVVLSTSQRLEKLQLNTIGSQELKIEKIDVLLDRRIENTALVDVSITAAPELGTDFWQLDASLVHYGSETKNQDLTLVVKPDIEIASSVKLPPNKVVRHSFQFAAPISKPTRGKVALKSDRLAYDDTAHFWLLPSQTIQVLAINGEQSSQPQEDELFYFKAAVADSTTKSNEFDLRHVPLDAWTSRQWNQPDVVMLANPGPLPSALAAQLETFVNSGGGLLITLGDQVDVETLNRQLSNLLPRRLRGFRRAGDAAASDQGRDRKPARIQGFQEDHSILSQIPNPDETSISQARVSNYSLFTTDVTQGVSEIIRLDEGAPLLLASKKGTGTVLVLSTSIDREWTDLPIQPDFVPFTIGLLRFAAQRSPKVSQTLKQGNQLKLTYPDGEGLQFKLDTPSGTTRTVDVKEVDDRWRIIGGLEQIGHYVASDTDGKAKQKHYFSVLPNSAASDLVQQRSEAPAEEKSSRGTIDTKQPEKLWPYALLILFILLALESQMAYRTTQKET